MATEGYKRNFFGHVHPGVVGWFIQVNLIIYSLLS